MRSGVESAISELRLQELRQSVLLLVSKVAKLFVKLTPVDVEILFPSNIMPLLIRSFSIAGALVEDEGYRSVPKPSSEEEAKLALEAVDTYLRKYRNIEEIINALLKTGFASQEQYMRKGAIHFFLEIIGVFTYSKGVVDDKIFETVVLPLLSFKQAS